MADGSLRGAGGALGRWMRGVLPRLAASQWAAGTRQPRAISGGHHRRLVPTQRLHRCEMAEAEAETSTRAGGTASCMSSR
jgi:hypothetical protein|eukprot:COSAG01_NODE_1201_length_11274_cov_639.212349_1_plen_80_part_00